MTKSTFVDYVTQDLLSELSGVSARAMFGGYGLYKDGTIFGIVVDDTVYFKVDETSRPDYEKRGSTAFTYAAKGGKRVAMSYWEVPTEILEDREALAEWAERSLKISRRMAPPTKGTG